MTDDESVMNEKGPDGFPTDRARKAITEMFDRDFPHGVVCDCKECLQREVARLRDDLEVQARYARRDRQHAVRANADREAAREELREALDELADRQKFLHQVIAERDLLAQKVRERNEIARKLADKFDDLDTLKKELVAAKESNRELESEAWKRDAEIDAYRELLGAIWLYVKWHYVTKQLTTEQKQMWADAVDSFGETDEGPKAERWWEH
jgi:hypothetical protein